MLCGAFHNSCTTFSLNLYGVEAMKIKYIQKEIIEVSKFDDLSKNDHRQKYYYKCDECGKLRIVMWNFNKDLNNRDSFLCNKCRNYHRQIEKYNKIPITNERIYVDKNTDLNSLRAQLSALEDQLIEIDKLDEEKLIYGEYPGKKDIENNEEEN